MKIYLGWAAAIFVFAFFILAVYWMYFDTSVKDSVIGARESQIRTDSTKTEIENLEALWKQHPDHAPIALQLAALYEEKGDNQNAVKYYRAFLKSDTSSAGWEVHLDLCRVLFNMNKINDAKAELQWILNKDPNHAGALYNLGAIEANNGQLDSAKFHWQKLMTAHPEDTLATFVARSMKIFEKPVGHP